jgi:hypothetical protein
MNADFAGLLGGAVFFGAAMLYPWYGWWPAVLVLATMCAGIHLMCGIARVLVKPSGVAVKVSWFWVGLFVVIATCWWNSMLVLLYLIVAMLFLYRRWLLESADAPQSPQPTVYPAAQVRQLPQGRQLSQQMPARNYERIR